MKMWVIQSNEPVEGTFLSRSLQKGVGGSSSTISDLWDRKLLQWAISSSGEIREQMEHHQNALVYHRGGKRFWFDGGINGHITTPQFLGYGDGNRKHFQLPYRFVYPQSIIMSVDHVVNTNWTAVFSTGLVMFDTAPPLNSLIHAEEFRCEFKGFFVVESDVLYKVTDNFKSFNSADIVIMEFPY